MLSLCYEIKINRAFKEVVEIYVYNVYAMYVFVRYTRKNNVNWPK